MSTEIELKNIIVSHPHLWTPHHYMNNPNNPARYGLSAILPQDFDWSVLQAAIQEAIQFKGGNINPEMPWSPVKDGPYANFYKLGVYRNAEKRPPVVDQNVQIILDQSQVFAGCRANVFVNVYVSDQGKVALWYKGLQLVDNVNVTRLGNEKSADQMFQPVAGAPAPTAPAAPAAPMAPPQQPAAPMAPPQQPAAPMAPPQQPAAPMAPPQQPAAPMAPPQQPAAPMAPPQQPAAPVAPGQPMPWNQ